MSNIQAEFLFTEVLLIEVTVEEAFAWETVVGKVEISVDGGEVFGTSAGTFEVVGEELLQDFDSTVVASLRVLFLNPWLVNFLV